MRVAFVSCGLEHLGIEALSAWVRQAGQLPLLPLAAEPDYPGEWCGWVQVSVTHCPYRSLLVGSSNIVTPLPSQGFRTRRDIPLVDRGREDRLLLLERTP